MVPRLHPVCSMSTSQGFVFLSIWLSSNETICFVGTGGLTAVIPASVIQAGNITLQPQQVQMQPQNLSTKGTSLSLSYINIYQAP